MKNFSKRLALIEAKIQLLGLNESDFDWFDIDKSIATLEKKISGFEESVDLLSLSK